MTCCCSPQGGAASSGLGGQLTATDLTNTVAIAAAQTHTVFTGSDFAWAGSAFFTLTAAGAILTYSGPAATFLVHASLSHSYAANVTSNSSILVNVNGDFVGSTPMFQAGQAAAGALYVNQQNNAGTKNLIVTAQRRVSLVPTDTLRVTLARQSNVAVDIGGFTMQVWQVAA